MNNVIFLVLALTGWIIWTTALNTPFLPDGWSSTEAIGWPVALFVGGGAIFLGAAAQFASFGNWVAPSAFSFGLISAALAVRLAVLPLAPDLSPLNLVGVREALALMAILYVGFASWVWTRTKRSGT